MRQSHRLSISSSEGADVPGGPLVPQASEGMRTDDETRGGGYGSSSSPMNSAAAGALLLGALNENDEDDVISSSAFLVPPPNTCATGGGATNTTEEVGADAKGAAAGAASERARGGDHGHDETCTSANPIAFNGNVADLRIGALKGRGATCDVHEIWKGDRRYALKVVKLALGSAADRSRSGAKKAQQMVRNDPCLRAVQREVDCLRLFADKRARKKAGGGGDTDTERHEPQRDQDLDHVIQFYGGRLDTANAKCYLFLEYAHCDMHDFWAECTLSAQRGMPFDTVLQCWWQMALGVEAVHAAGVVHFDIKLENFLLVLPDGGDLHLPASTADANARPPSPTPPPALPEGARIKVSDFGLAGRLSRIASFSSTPAPVHEDATAADEKNATHVSRMAGNLGTLPYLAPERVFQPDCDAMKLRPSVDVWSLGIVLYKLLYGQTPYYNIPHERIGFVINDPRMEIQFPLVQRFFDIAAPRYQGQPGEAGEHADVSLDFFLKFAHLRRVLKGCLQRDPAARPAASDIVHELDALMAGRHPAEVGSEASGLRARALAFAIRAPARGPDTVSLYDSFYDEAGSGSAHDMSEDFCAEESCAGTARARPPDQNDHDHEVITSTLAETDDDDDDDQHNGAAFNDERPGVIFRDVDVGVGEKAQGDRGATTTGNVGRPTGSGAPSASESTAPVAGYCFGSSGPGSQEPRASFLLDGERQGDEFVNGVDGRRAARSKNENEDIVIELQEQEPEREDDAIDDSAEFSFGSWLCLGCGCGCGWPLALLVIGFFTVACVAVGVAVPLAMLRGGNDQGADGPDGTLSENDHIIFFAGGGGGGGRGGGGYNEALPPAVGTGGADIFGADIGEDDDDENEDLGGAGGSGNGLAPRGRKRIPPKFRGMPPSLAEQGGGDAEDDNVNDKEDGDREDGDRDGEDEGEGDEEENQEPPRRTRGGRLRKHSSRTGAGAGVAGGPAGRGGAAAPVVEIPIVADHEAGDEVAFSAAAAAPAHASIASVPLRTEAEEQGSAHEEEQVQVPAAADGEGDGPEDVLGLAAAAAVGGAGGATNGATRSRLEETSGLLPPAVPVSSAPASSAVAQIHGLELDGSTADPDTSESSPASAPAPAAAGAPTESGGQTVRAETPPAPAIMTIEKADEEDEVVAEAAADAVLAEPEPVALPLSAAAVDAVISPAAAAPELTPPAQVDGLLEDGVTKRESFPVPLSGTHGATAEDVEESSTPTPTPVEQEEPPGGSLQPSSVEGPEADLEVEERQKRVGGSEGSISAPALPAPLPAIPCLFSPEVPLPSLGLAEAGDETALSATAAGVHPAHASSSIGSVVPLRTEAEQVSAVPDETEPEQMGLQAEESSGTAQVDAGPPALVAPIALASVPSSSASVSAPAVEGSGPGPGSAAGTRPSPGREGEDTGDERGLGAEAPPAAIAQMEAEAEAADEEVVVEPPATSASLAAGPEVEHYASSDPSDVLSERWEDELSEAEPIDGDDSIADVEMERPPDRTAAEGEGEERPGPPPETLPKEDETPESLSAEALQAGFHPGDIAAQDDGYESDASAVSRVSRETLRQSRPAVTGLEKSECEPGLVEDDLSLATTTVPAGSVLSTFSSDGSEVSLAEEEDDVDKEGDLVPGTPRRDSGESEDDADEDGNIPGNPAARRPRGDAISTDAPTGTPPPRHGRSSYLGGLWSWRERGDDAFATDAGLKRSLGSAFETQTAPSATAGTKQPRHEVSGLADRHLSGSSASGEEADADVGDDAAAEVDSYGGEASAGSVHVHRADAAASADMLEDVDDAWLELELLRIMEAAEQE